jgi:hypothetical protein
VLVSKRFSRLEQEETANQTFVRVFALASAPDLANLGDEPGRRKPPDEWENANLGAHTRQHGALTRKQGFGTIIAAFDIDIRSHGGKESMGAGLWEDDHGVHAGERGEDGGALSLRDERTPRTLEFADGAVAVQANNKEVPKLAGALEIGYVAEVQQVETTVRGDHALAAAAGQRGPADGLSQC